jgi:uncharacterized protein (DUF983 family)
MPNLEDPDMRADPLPVTYSSLPRAEAAGPRRPVFPAMLRGLRKRCPNCGRGRMFTGYLKVADSCPACGEELVHHRADDLPPYLTIVVVGHIIVPAILFVETRWPQETFTHLAIWLPLTLILSLALLPMMKGAVVGLQWALRMHGFDRSERTLPEPDSGFAAIGDFDENPPPTR